MSLAYPMLQELTHENASTRRLLERVPGDQLGWRPHAKSMTLGRLAMHIAELQSWGSLILATDELDLAGPAMRGWKPVEPAGTADIVAKFDTDGGKALADLRAASDECLMGNWTLRKGETVIVTMPRIAQLRSFVCNHVFHHRGQLTVYLRLLDVPLPSVYGPTADEGAGF